MQTVLLTNYTDRLMRNFLTTLNSNCINFVRTVVIKLNNATRLTSTNIDCVEYYAYVCIYVLHAINIKCQLTLKLSVQIWTKHTINETRQDNEIVLKIVNYVNKSTMRGQGNCACHLDNASDRYFVFNKRP
jgi:hypothetical protein